MYKKILVNIGNIYPLYSIHDYDTYHSSFIDTEPDAVGKFPRMHGYPTMISHP